MKRAARRGRLLPWLLVAPLVVFIAALSFYPTVVTTIEAFFRVSPLDPPTRFDGLGNFRALFANSAVTTSWLNTVVYAVTGVVLSTVLGVAGAVALKRRFRFRGLVLAMVILPWALPAVDEAVIWNWMYDPNFGVINSTLHSLHLIGGYHVFLGLDRWLTVVLIEIVQVWQITPLSLLIVLAALQSIPLDLYEAARVDGAGAWSSFRRVTLPLIRPAIAVAAVQAIVLSLNVFDQVY
ncbi:MAG: carbohydrate ABC transporter permease, partial [Streptosporangiaceae bacterium]